VSQAMSLKSEIQKVVHNIPATFGVAIKYLEAGEQVLLNTDRTYQLASVFKIPVLVTAMQQIDAGRFSLDDRIELTDANKVMPSGILSFLREGLQPTVEDLLMLMIVVSDNTATDMVLDLIGGPQAVNTSLRQLGFSEDDINITMSVRDLLEDVFGTSKPLLKRSEMVSWIRERGVNFEGAVYQEGSTTNVATPRAINRLNEMIFRGQVASREACDKALDILLHQTLNDRLPRQLPPDNPDVKIAHKTGTIFGVRNDSGIIYVADDVHVAVTILTREEGKLNLQKVMNPAIKEVETEIDKAIGQIGKLAYEYSRKTE
jgi:beta-lactamase class A